MTRKGRQRIAWRVVLLRSGAASLLFAVGAAIWLLWPFWHLSRTLGDRTSVAPSRVYARPMLLEVGSRLSPTRFEELLADLGYRRRSGTFPSPGEFAVVDDGWVVHRRAFPTLEGTEAPALLKVELDGSNVGALSLRGQSVRGATLEPVLLATLVGPQRQDRRPVRLDELPETLVQAVLAAEDAGFFHHAGISLTGVARAAWRNVFEDGPLEGGSTLTQQLVKNLYLTHERTVARKLREAVLALLIELRYDKREVLEAYLNEIYWGQSGGVNLIGVGAASRAYFGKDAAYLSVAEASTLAGVIQAPNYLSPARHPERARVRRDWVLRRMLELGWLADNEYQAAIGAEVEVARNESAGRRAPYFVDRALAEVEARFGVDASVERGLTVFTTLDWGDQLAADRAVSSGLETLERERVVEPEGGGPLQAALVSVAADSGAIRAWVGGRDYQASQFDRASQARRQAGSAFKPVVYAAALQRGLMTPASMIPDEPLTVRTAGVTWEPQNDDRDFRGWVTVRTALERSLNVPTARIALETGLGEVLETARAFGIGGRLRPFPALALGAFEVTPEELVGVYATLASGGVRRSAHGVQGVVYADGRPLRGEAVAQASRVLSPQVAYILTSLLQGVVEHGTARGVRERGLDEPVAGKTGTTNGRRDSWFGGYSPDRATLVWVGYDDNRETMLSGAVAALPIWTDFATAVRPPGGYEDFARPEGLETAAIDPETGLRATLSCPVVQSEVFLDGQAPRRFCYLHEGVGSPRTSAVAGEALAPPEAPKRRPWWKRLLGRKKKPKDDGRDD